MPEGGRLTIETAGTPDASIAPIEVEPGEYVVVGVSDGNRHAAGGGQSGRPSSVKLWEGTVSGFP